MVAKSQSRLLLVSAIVVGFVILCLLLYFLILRQLREVKRHQLVELKSVFTTSDTLENFLGFINDVWLDEGAGKLYALDRKTNCIAVFDTSLDFLYRIGRAGHAGNEFASPMWIRSRDSIIYVSDFGHGRLKLLRSDGGYMGDLPLSVYQLLYPFAVDHSGCIVANAPFDADSLLVVYDTAGRIVRQFGQRVKQPAERQTLRRNLVWPVVGEDGSIYVVFESLPYIRKYSKDFQLLGEKDVTSATELRWTFRRLKENEKRNPQAIHSMLGGVYYRRPYLYVNYGTDLPHGATLFAYDANTLELREATVANISAHSWDSVRVVGSFVILPGSRNVVSFDMNTGRLVKYAVR
ncbi:MAG: hypothetical protein ACP5JH_09425 [Bacteroidota bacterium]